MERYLVFAGKHLSPEGGWADFIQDFKYHGRAEGYIVNKLKLEWAQVVDTQDRTTTTYFSRRVTQQGGVTGLRRTDPHPYIVVWQKDSFTQHQHEGKSHASSG